MKTPHPNPKTPASAPETPPAAAAPVESKATAAGNLQAAILYFGLQFDVPVPLEYFEALISRSGAFRARADGRLHLEEVRSRAAVKPSELARYLRNEPRADPTQN